MSLRRENEVSYVRAVSAQEAHSVFAKPEHARLLAEFLRSKGVRFTEDYNTIPGEVNILGDKETTFEEFNRLLNEWKRQYAEAAG